MTNELKAHTASGKTLYAVLLDTNGQAWNGSALEAFSGANWLDYAIVLTEAAAGIYYGDMPAAAQGMYSFPVYEQASGTPATTDALRGVGSIAWSGTAEIVPAAAALEAVVQAILEDTGTTLPGLISNLGTGARTILITVDDGTDPLEAARVRLTQGVETYVGSTDASGQVTFNVNDATWTVAITKAGYTYAGTTLTVDGDKTPTYSMTAVSFSASAPGQSTGWVYCYDENGDAETGVTINIQQTATPETDSYAFDTVVRAGTSDENGLVEFTGLWIGATYQVRRYSGSWHSVTIPNSASFALPALLGK